MSAVLAARIRDALPFQVRTWVNKAQFRPVPPPRARLRNPNDFLKAIGRKAETKVQAETWDEFWKLDGEALKKAGLSVQDRRYILWSMEKFHQGENPEDFAHEAQPKKKIRGRGPAVQNGKRIRSRRHR
ncbi:hypothetical protein K474DRAFT_1665934 [Panus rudis PR-1116 ss-1]|nr:hypothetical protein K474DRAFT_1665934 [Panus rudis PR-1116 ss-1]